MKYDLFTDHTFGYIATSDTIQQQLELFDGVIEDESKIKLRDFEIADPFALVEKMNEDATKLGNFSFGLFGRLFVGLLGQGDAPPRVGVAGGRTDGGSTSEVGDAGTGAKDAPSRLWILAHGAGRLAPWHFLGRFLSPIGGD